MTAPTDASRHQAPRSTAIWPPPTQWSALYPLLTGLRWLPGHLAEDLVAAAALLQGLASRRRRRRALEWATRQPGTPKRSPTALACGLLAFRGRQLATRQHLGVRDQAAFRARVTLEGEEHLGAATQAGGVLLIGFHLGPLVDPVALRAYGYPVTVGLRGQRVPTDRPAWWQHPPEDLVLFPNAAWRLRGLYELRRRLESGRTVYLGCDGLHGAEAFRIELPGLPLILRTGWLALRRSTRATTIPVLSRREGRRTVVAIHPPLPPPAPTLEQDIAACRACLTPLLEDYVRRFPEQCFQIALQPLPTSPGPREAR